MSKARWFNYMVELSKQCIKENIFGETKLKKLDPECHDAVIAKAIGANTTYEGDDVTIDYDQYVDCYTKQRMALVAHKDDWTYDFEKSGSFLDRDRAI